MLTRWRSCMSCANISARRDRARHETGNGRDGERFGRRSATQTPQAVSVAAKGAAARPAVGGDHPAVRDVGDRRSPVRHRAVLAAGTLRHLRGRMAMAVADPRQCVADVHDNRDRIFHRGGLWPARRHAVGSSTMMYDGFYPALIGFNTIPKVAVIPILVIWFGVGTVPAVITAFLLSFFPILVNVATGIATVEPELRDVLRALGASRWQVIQKVGLPRSMPYFFASLKVAITVAFVGSIVAETVAANKGIGHLMLVASSRFEVPLAFAGLLV